MFGANCKFAQFRNCVAQFENFEIASVPISKLSSDLHATQFRNCAACAISKSRNFNMHAHFQNCVRACVIKPPLSNMDQLCLPELTKHTTHACHICHILTYRRVEFAEY